MRSNRKSLTTQAREFFGGDGDRDPAREIAELGMDARREMAEMLGRAGYPVDPRSIGRALGKAPRRAQDNA